MGAGGGGGGRASDIPRTWGRKGDGMRQGVGVGGAGSDE